MTINQQERELYESHIANAKRKIFVQFQKEGIHCYPAAGVEISMALLKVKNNATT